MSGPVLSESDQLEKEVTGHGPLPDWVMALLAVVLVTGGILGFLWLRPENGNTEGPDVAGGGEETAMVAPPGAPGAGAAGAAASRQVEGEEPGSGRSHDPAAVDVEAWRARVEEALASPRPDAARGDLLDPAVVAHLRRLTEEVLDGPGGEQALALIHESDPLRTGVASAAELLQVGEPYPDDVPTTTVPPSLLERYPPLPDGVEYRFVGCRLLLLARDSRLILDHTDGCLW